MIIKHAHHFEQIGYKIEEDHSVDSDSGGICPYKGCAKKFLVFMCRECGDSTKVEVDMEQVSMYEK